MANTPEFKYAPMFQLGKDDTEYYLLSKEGVSTSTFEGKEILKVTPEALTLLSQQAFHDVEFMPLREFFLSAKTLARQLFMARKVSRCGQASTMPRLYHTAFTTRSHKTICATHKMRLSRCMTRLTPAATCLPKSTSRLAKVQNITS